MMQNSTSCFKAQDTWSMFKTAYELRCTLAQSTMSRRTEGSLEVKEMQTSPKFHSKTLLSALLLGLMLNIYHY